MKHRDLKPAVSELRNFTESHLGDQASLDIVVHDRAYEISRQPMEAIRHALECLRGQRDALMRFTISGGAIAIFGFLWMMLASILSHSTLALPFLLSGYNPLIGGMGCLIFGVFRLIKGCMLYRQKACEVEKKVCQSLRSIEEDGLVCEVNIHDQDEAHSMVINCAQKKPGNKKMTYDVHGH